jgi:collagen type VI alpha
LIVCNGQFDLTLVIDASANTGRSGFDSVKIFAKQLVDAFDVDGAGTRVSVISYSDKPRLNFGFSDLTRKDAIKNGIDRVGFQGGAASATSDALQLAVDKVYKVENGMRINSNKVN